MPLPTGYTLETPGTPGGYSPDVASAATQRLGGKPTLPIQPFEPPDQSQPGFMQRAGQFFGLPTQLNQILPWAGHQMRNAMLPPFMGMGMDAGQMGAQAGTQLGHGDFQGAGNTIAPQAANLGTDIGSFIDNPSLRGAGAIAGTTIPAAALALMNKFIPEGGTAPITDTEPIRGAPTMGPSYTSRAASLLPEQLKKWLVPESIAKSQRVTGFEPPNAQQMLSATDPAQLPATGGATSRPRPTSPTPITKPQFELGPIPPTNLFEAGPNANIPRGAAPANQPSPIQPVGPPQPFNTLPESMQKTLGGAETGSGDPYAGTRTKGVPRGGKPIPVAKVAPRTQAAMEAKTETSASAVEKPFEDFIPEDLAQPDSVMPDGKTIVDSISKDGKFASLLKVDAKSGKVRRFNKVPIRKLSDTALALYQRQLEEMLAKQGK